MSDLPIKEGLFHIPATSDDKPYLIGSKCKMCGYAAFPKKVVCVRCLRDDTMDDVRLGPYGTLETYAVMRVGPPDFPPPYMVGYVRVKEGPLIFSQITGCDVEDDALELGQEMELVIDKIKKDSKGNNVVGWKFRPVR